MDSNGPTPLRFFVFSHYRTGSHLFCRILSEHPRIKQHLYPFEAAHTLGPEAQTQMKGEKKAEYVTYQACQDLVEQQIAGVEAEVRHKPEGILCCS